MAGDRDNKYIYIYVCVCAAVAVGQGYRDIMLSYPYGVLFFCRRQGKVLESRRGRTFL